MGNEGYRPEDSFDRRTAADYVELKRGDEAAALRFLRKRAHDGPALELYHRPGALLSNDLGEGAKMIIAKALSNVHRLQGFTMWMKSTRGSFRGICL